MLASFWEQSFVKGKVNPVASIFLGKNWFGYKDSVEIVSESDYDKKPLTLADLPKLDTITDKIKESKESEMILIVIHDLTSLIKVHSAFERYTSPEIADFVLTTPDGEKQGGKSLEVSILMSDLRGFTAMSERMDAADLIAMLNHYLGEMTEVIQGYGGTIIEFIGDGIMAIFGAPAPSDTHAADAIAAAVAMEARMEAVNAWNAERGYPVLEMGIGLNTGEVIVGNIGSEKRTKYGVVGSHVNLCGRIESYTVGGQVLISPLTRELAKVELEVAQEMTVYPKGVKGELVLSQVTGVGAPYNVSAKVKDTRPQALKQPIPVRFHMLAGKHGGAKSFYGGVVAVAHDGAVLDTGAELNIFDNVQLEAGGKLFAKVMEQTEEGFLLRYTSIPAGYEAWLKAESAKAE